MRHRLLSLVMSIGLVVICAAGAKNLVFTNDYRVFFSGDDPHLLAFEAMQDTYSKNDNVLIALAPDDGVVFKPSTLAAIADITERAWQTPFSVRVDSLSNFQHTEAEGDDLLVGNLYEDAQALDKAGLKRIKDIALNEPLLIHRLIAADARVSGINVTVELPGLDEAAEGPEVVAYIRELRDYIRETYPDLKPYLSGIVMMNAAFPEASLYDITHLIPAAFGIVLLLVFLQLRGFGGTVATFLTILMSIISAMGVAGWMGIKLSPPAMSAPTIILTLAVADCVHILSSWLHKYHEGMDKREAMRESLRINFSPVFLTSVTTAIGFLSLNFSDAPPFHDLGNISAMGVMFAWFYAVFFLPALVTLLPAKQKAESGFGTKTMNRFADWVVDKRRILLPVMSITIVATMAFIPKNELNDVFIEYFDERVEFRTDTDFVVKNLTGLYWVDYSLDSSESGGISNPEFLAQMQSFTKYLLEQPEVIHVNTLTDIFKRVNKSMHADEPPWYKLPEQRELAAQYLLLYEMSLPYGLDLNNQIDIDKRQTRLSVTLKTISTSNMLEFEARIDKWLQENTPEIQTIGASPTVMFSHIGMRNIVSMLTGTVFALVAISLILVLFFRSFRYGLLSLIPNIAPAGMAFGIWAMVDGEIGLGLSVVAAMTLGIVVDDTIHFMSKYLRARHEQGLDATGAVKYAFSTVGVALWTTSVALVAGFMVISTSSFQLNAQMGVLVSAIIALALFVDFFLLPALLIRFDPWLEGGRKPVISSTDNA